MRVPYPRVRYPVCEMRDTVRMPREIVPMILRAGMLMLLDIVAAVLCVG